MECVESCSKILEQNPYDEQIWSLKTRALTEQVHVCDVEADEEGIVDVVLDDNTIRAVPRPGTSKLAREAAICPSVRCFHPRTRAPDAEKKAARARPW